MKNRIAEFLYRLGVSANLLTAAGLLMAAYSGWLAFRGDLFWAGLVLLASGLVDMLDGAVARVSKTDSAFGGILDSSLDRYGDGFIFGGLIFYFMQLGRVETALFTISAWLGSFLISYVRARAECETDSCRVGFWERGERIGVLVIGFLSGHIAMAVVILGVATHWTVFQRLSLAYLSVRSKTLPKDRLPFYLRAAGRSERVYFAKVAFLVGLLLWGAA